MTLITNATLLGESGCIVRQRVATTKRFTGVRTAHADGVQRSSILRGKYTYDSNPADGEGLFELAEMAGVGSIPAKRPPFFFISSISVWVGAGIDWHLYVTDGDATGTALTTVDDPANDLLLMDGTGDGFYSVQLVVAPFANLRFISDAATTRVAGGQVDITIQAQSPRTSSIIY